MKGTVLIIISSFLSLSGYENLQTYKNQHPTKIEKKNSNLLIVRFKDINSFNFSEFENRYQVRLSYCIADGICIFEAKQGEDIEELATEIREDNILKSVKVYIQERMKTY